MKKKKTVLMTDKKKLRFTYFYRVNMTEKKKKKIKEKVLVT